MKSDYLNIYNNLIKLTRNKNLYLNLKNNDTFSDRLIILLFHYSFFIKFYKNQISIHESQDLFDFIIRQIELSIREILAKQRPEEGILGEEYGKVTSKSGLTWVLDPIDGTRYFVIGNPTWSNLKSLY